MSAFNTRDGKRAASAVIGFPATSRPVAARSKFLSLISTMKVTKSGSVIAPEPATCMLGGIPGRGWLICSVLVLLAVLVPRDSIASVIAYWQFESGAFTTDSANSNALTNSGVTPSSDVASNAPGFGSASFGGTQSIFSTTTTLDLSATTDLTIEWFMKSTQTTTALVIEHGPGTGSGVFGTAINDTFAAPNTIEAFQRTGTFDAYLEKTVSNVLDGGWHHVAMTIDGSETFTNRISLYIDGSDVGTYVSVGSPSGIPSYLDATFYIGSRADSSLKFSGLLDELRISNTILAPSQFLNAATTATPEPATLALLAFGLAGIGFRRRMATNMKGGGGT